MKMIAQDEIKKRLAEIKARREAINPTSWQWPNGLNDGEFLDHAPADIEFLLMCAALLDLEDARDWPRRLIDNIGT